MPQDEFDLAALEEGQVSPPPPSPRAPPPSPTAAPADPRAAPARPPTAPPPTPTPPPPSFDAPVPAHAQRGLSAAEVADRVQRGLVNRDDSKQRRDRDVVRENALTYFNLVLFS